MATPQATFQGFQFPTTTPVPDEVFDVLLPTLSGAELKVLLYICRRTFGFQKESDTISLNQIAQGITTRDGRVLDLGTGLSKRHVQRALRALEKKHIITVTRAVDETGCNSVNTYALTMQAPQQTGQEQGVGTPSPKGRDTTIPGVGTPASGGVGTAMSPGVETPVSTTTNRKQETEKQHDDDARCTALEQFGISNKQAVRLTNEYSRAYIFTKLAMVQGLVATESPLVAKNPQGFLVRAIEENYPPPRRNHRFRHNAQAAGEEAERADQQDARFAGSAFVATSAKEAAPARRAARHQEEQQPVPAEETPVPSADPSRTPETVWSRTLALLQEQMPAPAFTTWLKDTMLVGIGKGVARIKVPSSQVASWLERSLYWRIVQALRDILPEKAVAEVQFVTA